MKKLVTTAALSVLVLFLTGTAFGQSRENIGCGLGTMLLQDQSNDSTLFQVLAVTTNGTLGTQTFGITSGTSECKKPTNLVSNQELNEFVVANMDNLAKDMARGGGETLDAFADLMQVPAAQRPEFYRKLQVNFGSVFKSGHVVMADVVDNSVAVTR